MAAEAGRRRSRIRFDSEQMRPAAGLEHSVMQDLLMLDVRRSLHKNAALGKRCRLQSLRYPQNLRGGRDEHLAHSGAGRVPHAEATVFTLHCAAVEDTDGVRRVRTFARREQRSLPDSRRRLSYYGASAMNKPGGFRRLGTPTPLLSELLSLVGPKGDLRCRPLGINLGNSRR